MKKRFLILIFFAAGCVSIQHSRGVDRAFRGGPEDFLEKAVVGPQGDGTYVVPTTQRINPAGDTLLFPGRPVGLALSPDGTTMAVKNMKDILLVDPAARSIVQTLPLPKDGASFCGIAWSGDGSTVWTTSSKRYLHCAERDKDGFFQWTGQVDLPGPKNRDNSAPGGLALDESRGKIYVTLSRNNSLGVVDIASKELTREIPVGIAPYDVLILGSKAYVTNWGGGRPLKGDLTGPTAGSQAVIDEAGIASTGTLTVIGLDRLEPVHEIDVDLHPTAMALSPDGARLYVANANSDTISVIDTASDTVAERWLAKSMPELPFGSAPNALCLSPDGKILYVALGGNNSIAVMDTQAGRVKGLIPTGWYPGAVHLAQQGSLLCVANTKGVGSRLRSSRSEWNRLGPDKEAPAYNSHDHLGSLTLVPVPNASQLEEYTFQVAVQMRLPRMHEALQLKKAQERTVPVPTQPGERSVFKHVLYIIKENRTYDQVFGDLPQGNGDPTLCQFGREVTPNHHALAEQFVLLDNFYCNGVLSADGHQWTDEGYVTDYLEKSFGGFTRSYPYEGDDALAFASSGFIWDHVLRAGLTFRDYGEMIKARITPENATWEDVYQDYLQGTRKVRIQATTPVRGLEDYICPTFIGFPCKVQDVYRAGEFLREFEECVERGEWQNFTIMLLPNDHTVGTTPHYPTPRATVADNDLALGRIVEAVSNSPFWPETAIFVVEDDPQAGLDHVDGHRTVALCISPYTRRQTVDSTFYNQNSMLRTMELILGLAPMNQMNLAANPMTNCFMDKPDFTPYRCKPNIVPLDEMNPPLQSLRGRQRYYALKSLELPLDEVDQADEDLFNRIIWHSVKGYNVPYPELTRNVIVGRNNWTQE
jgi:YVTN family beta-propeller protein